MTLLRHVGHLIALRLYLNILSHFPTARHTVENIFITRDDLALNVTALKALASCR